jgi:chromodomain-helicase-DNA-binding protein 7
LVKWRSQGYAAATWEAAGELGGAEDAAAVERFQQISVVRRACSRKEARLPQQKVLVEPPAFRPGCVLRDYQRESFDWMVRNARSKPARSVILGDEMGLGKTAQSVAVLEWLRLHAPPALRRPFLVVAPLTTLVHWQREVEKWTSMNAVIYGGSAEDKRACVHHEFYSRGAPRRAPSRDQLLFDCLLISYETLRRDAGLLGSLPWGVIVADEAHRLKGMNSATSTVLRESYRPGWLLMLTGTPVQNNLAELFGLLHLLDAAAFPSLEEFQERFCPGGVIEAARIPALTAALRPYLLRRMKEDVETIPEKEEVVVWVEMTADQRAYYKALHEQKMHVLLAANSRKNMPSSRNLLMELRQCVGGSARLLSLTLSAAAAATTPSCSPAWRTTTPPSARRRRGRRRPPSRRPATRRCWSAPAARCCCSASCCPSCARRGTRCSSSRSSS